MKLLNLTNSPEYTTNFFNKEEYHPSTDYEVTPTGRKREIDYFMDQNLFDEEYDLESLPLVEETTICHQSDLVWNSLQLDQTTQNILFYLRNIGSLNVPDNREIVELLMGLKFGQNDEKEACLNKLVLGYQYIVIEEVLYFRKNGIDLEDLIQVGNIALIEAIKKCTPQMGTIVSYLHRNVYRTIQNFCLNNFSLVRFPLNRVLEIVSHYFHKYNSDEYLCNKHYYLKVIDDFPRGYKNFLENDNYTETLYMRINEDYLDLLPNDKVYDHETDLNQGSFKYAINKILSTLDAREADVIKMYFGIDRDYALTLNEIGEEFGLTRERVRQIKEKAIKRLKHASRIKYISKYCFEEYPEYIRTSNFWEAVLSDPFYNTDHSNEAIHILEKYLKPKKRTRKHHIKNMAESCRKIILKYLNNVKRPCSYQVLREHVYKVYPHFTDGTFQYALSTIPALIRLDSGDFALSEWRDSQETDIIILGKRYKEIQIDF